MLCLGWCSSFCLCVVFDCFGFVFGKVLCLCVGFECFVFVCGKVCAQAVMLMCWTWFVCGMMCYVACMCVACMLLCLVFVFGCWCIARAVAGGGWSGRGRRLLLSFQNV